MQSMKLNVSVAEDAKKTIKQLAHQSADGNETGGILLGRGPANDGVIRVELAGDAGPEAIREPGYFLRDLNHAKDLADRAWRESKAIWIGEWHTHPHRDPKPSSVDLTTYARLLGAVDLELKAFVSVIAVPDASGKWDDPHLFSWILALQDAGPTPSPDARSIES